MDLESRVAQLARSAADGRYGHMSTGELCAVALLNNDARMLPSGYTFLDAVDRLEDEWVKACLSVNRTGWRK